MLFDTEQSRSSGSLNLKMWNPTETLGIINPDPSYNCITCLGYAPSKRRRCRNPINASNRAFIKSTLDEISYFSPRDSMVTSRLRLIASSTLCVRFHQNQTESVLQKWQQSINQLKLKPTERADAPSLDSRYLGSVKSGALSDLEAHFQEMTEMIASLRAQLSEEQNRNRTGEQESASQIRSRQEEELRRGAQKQREQEARKQKDERRKRQQEEEEHRKRAEEERRERMEEERRRKQDEEEREQRRKDMEDEARRRKEQQQREKADTEEANERMRQNAQKAREANAARKKKEREEWDEAWETYQERWAAFKLVASRKGDIRDSIPWPVKSGQHSDVTASSVKKFMELATPRDGEMVRLMRKECQKWHPDKVSAWLQGGELSVDDSEMIDTICRVVTDLLNSKAGRSAEFL